MIFLPKIHTQKSDWHSGCANACVSCVNSIVGNAICNFQVRWRHHAVCSWTSDVMIGPDEMGDGCAFRHRNKYAQLAYQCLCKIVQVRDTQRKHISNCASNRKKNKKKISILSETEKKPHTAARCSVSQMNHKSSEFKILVALSRVSSTSNVPFIIPDLHITCSHCILIFLSAFFCWWRSFYHPCPIIFFLASLKYQKCTIDKRGNIS